MDVDAALHAAALTNLDNVKTAGLGRSREHDKAAEKVEVIFEQSLAKSTGGAEAVKILSQYRQKVKELGVLRDADEVKIVKMVRNADLILMLVSERIALRARYEGLIGRYKPIAAIRQMAEVEARAYMNPVNKGITP